MALDDDTVLQAFRDLLLYFWDKDNPLLLSPNPQAVEEEEEEEESEEEEEHRTETMDKNQSCSETSCNIYEGAGKLPFVTNAEVKTENEENMLDINKEGRNQTVTFKLPGMPAQVVTVNMEEIQEVIHVKVEPDDEDVIHSIHVKVEPDDEDVIHSIRVKVEPDDEDVIHSIRVKVEPDDEDVIHSIRVKVEPDDEDVIHSIKVERIDEIEREDFEEENRILNCSKMVMDNKKMEEQSHFPGNLSSANSSLASSSETISNLSNLINNEFHPPGCSRSDENCDSNTTIKNMIQSKNYIYVNVVPELPKQIEPVVFKNDFMKTLLASGPANVEEKVYNKGRLYKGDREMEQYLGGTCEGDQAGNGSGSSERNKDSFTVSSTSNADKLLGLTGGSSSDPKHQSPSYSQRYEDDDSSDDSDELCTCLSTHEDDDESDMLETSAEERLWRKRRYEVPIVYPPQSAKKFCVDGASGSGAGENDWPPNLPGTSLGGANIQGPPEVKQWLSTFQSWSNGERIQAIEALISRCAASQVRHMMKAIEPLFQRDFISLLPKELALTVLGYLKPVDLLRAAQTCRYWRFLAEDNLLWKEQCRRDGIVCLKRLPRALPHCASVWKAAYMRQFLIEENWLSKPVTHPKVMRGHDDHVITCLQFYGTRILSGSDDTTLKVWSAITGKCLTNLVGHSGGVWSSQMVGNLVISGSTDRTLRVWDAKSGQCKRVLTGHTSTVRCMHLHGDKVVSGSRDATLRLWNIKTGACLRVLIGHLAAVRCVQYDGRVIVSGAYDYFVKIWNPNTGECLHTLAGHTNRVYSLQFDGIHVVSGSLDTSIRVWDVETGHLKHTLIGHQSLTSGMELHRNILVSGNADSTVKVWNIDTGHCLFTLSGPNKHQSAVTCLQTNKRFVVTSSDDGTVKLWCLRTGQFIRNLVQLSSRGSGGVVWRIRVSRTKLICAVGSRNGTEETKLLVLDFDVPGACRRCNE